MCSRRATIVALAQIGIFAPLALCQTPASESFDAVAIKHWNMELVKGGVHVSGGGLEAGAITLKDLIAEAYGVNDQGIAGTTSWMETERYNIHATAGRPATRSELMTMLQNMLADRFHLAIHHEPRQMKAYALVVDKGGPKLTPKNETFHPAPTPPGQTIIEFAYTIPDLLRQINSGRVTGQSIGRPVVDRTGLSGEYHMALRAETEPTPDGRGFRIDIDYFSAFRELGLRLDPIEESFDRIVVDNAAKPSLD
jgi:uncharacterized protein (TIGR03435 family)